MELRDQPWRIAIILNGQSYFKTSGYKLSGELIGVFKNMPMEQDAIKVSEGGWLFAIITCFTEEAAIQAQGHILKLKQDYIKAMLRKLTSEEVQ